MEARDIVIGTCDGTGAAINVCVGFIPRRVEVLNMESATYEKIEWDSQMALVSAIDEGIKTAGTGTVTRAAVAANGISEYAGGDEIIYDGATDNRWEDSAGNSVEEVYVNGHYQKEAAADAAYQCVGDAIEPKFRDGTKVTTPAGFTIGTDADINVNGEQIRWVAYR